MTGRVRCAAAALALLSLAGCHAVEESPERTVIRFDALSRVVMIAVPAAVIAAATALAYRFRAARIPAGIVIFCTAGLGGLLVPGMYLDAVVITPTEIDQPRGFWFERSPRGFRYADVRSVSIRDVREGEATIRVWTLRRKDGTTRELDPGDLWNFNEDLVVRKLRGYGVAFE